MSGECQKCGEHCLECTCDRQTIIQRVSRLERLAQLQQVRIQHLNTTIEDLETAQKTILKRLIQDQKRIQFLEVTRTESSQ